MSVRREGLLDPESLSRPERHVDRRQKRSVAEIVEAAGGCWYCARRSRRTEGWGRALCGKVIPAQFQGEGCTFEPDREQFEKRGIKL